MVRSGQWVNGVENSLARTNGFEIREKVEVEAPSDIGMKSGLQNKILDVPIHKDVVQTTPMKSRAIEPRLAVFN
jgi:hypothetical protein